MAVLLGIFVKVFCNSYFFHFWQLNWSSTVKRSTSKMVLESWDQVSEGWNVTVDNSVTVLLAWACFGIFTVSSGKASASLSLVLCSKKYWTDVRVLVTVTIWKRFLRANQALSSVCTPRPLRLSHQSNQFHQCRLPCDNQSVHGQIVFTGQVARVRLPRRDSACYGKIVLWSCFTDHVTWICSFRTTPNMFLAHCDEAVQ